MDKTALKWFAAFTAVFAVAAAWVFWGTWSCSVSPIMPDTTWQYPASLGEWYRGRLIDWLTSGLFAPDDVKDFLGSPRLWNELRYVLATYVSALAVVYYCRGRGLSRLAAYGGGILLAFSGYWLSLFSAGHYGWFRVMTYGLFTFGLIDRALASSRLRYWLLLGAVEAWGMFHQQDLWFMFSLLTAAYFIFACVQVRKVPWKGALIALAAFLLIGGPGFINGLGAMAGRNEQLEQAGGREKDAKGGDAAANAQTEEAHWIFVTNWSLPIAETAELMVPRLNGDTSCVLTQALGAKSGTGVRPYTGALGRPLGAPSGNYRQHSLYIGFVTCLLAIAGIVSLFVGGCRARMYAAFWLGAAVLSLLLAYGREFAPLYRLVFALPIGDMMRCPVKWLHLTEFAVAILAAFGLDWLSRRFPSKPVFVALVALVVIGTFDLARVNHLFCAPVDLTKAISKDATMQLTFLRQQDFANPQVANMLKAGMVQSLAYYPGRNDVYLVGILEPRQHSEKPFPPFTFTTFLGVVSLIASLGVLGCALAGLRTHAAEHG